MDGLKLSYGRNLKLETGNLKLEKKAFYLLNVKVIAQ